MNKLARQLAIATVLVTGCKETNSNYCEDVPVTHNCMDKADANLLCSNSAQCSGPTPVCDVSGTKSCVQCTVADSAACSGATPVCGPGNTCEKCTTHAQCSSNVCLPDGSCSDGANVAYVAATGSGAACTKAMPCGTLTAAVATNRPFVKIASGLLKDVNTTTIDARIITILADEGAKLDRDGDGPILEVKSANADVTIFDLEVTGASNANGLVVTPNGGAPRLTLTRVKVTANQGAGVYCTGGTVTVSQSTISTNQGVGVACSSGALTVSRSTISQNRGGGVSIVGAGATFDITNNFIYRNGNEDDGNFGGVNIGVTTAGSNRFEFNTVVDNRASFGATRVGGVLCDINAFTAANNIVARNSLAGSTSSSNSQIVGTCAYATSRVQGDVSDLAFEHPDPPAPFSYRITGNSSVKDQAITASTIAIDNEGDARPQGSQKDIGADEFK